jgi:hypothetical protein
MLNTGISFEWEGSVYFCDSCCRDIVELMPDAILMTGHETIIDHYMSKIMDLGIDVENAKRLQAKLDELGLKVEYKKYVPEPVEEVENEPSTDPGYDPDGINFTSDESEQPIDGEADGGVRIGGQSDGDNQKALFASMGAITFG